MSSTRDLIIGRLVGKELSCDPSCRGYENKSRCWMHNPYMVWKDLIHTFCINKAGIRNPEDLIKDDFKNDPLFKKIKYLT